MHTHARCSVLTLFRSTAYTHIPSRSAVRLKSHTPGKNVACSGGSGAGQLLLSSVGGRCQPFLHPGALHVTLSSSPGSPHISFMSRCRTADCCQPTRILAPASTAKSGQRFSSRCWRWLLLGPPCEMASQALMPSSGGAPTGECTVRPATPVTRVGSQSLTYHDTHQPHHIFCVHTIILSCTLAFSNGELNITILCTVLYSQSLTCSKADDVVPLTAGDSP
jgi:hypothetical protein